MKRIAFLLILCLLTLLLLTSCSHAVEIGEHEWTLRYAVDQSGGGYAFVAVAPSLAGTLPTNTVVDVRLSAVGGELTLVDFTNEKTYEGSYREDGESEEGHPEYAITLGESEGRAATALTTYYDEDGEPTLAIAIGNYILYFYAYQGNGS